MNIKIFTFFIFLFCTAVSIAQPLPESPLPDTISIFPGIKQIFTFDTNKRIHTVRDFGFDPVNKTHFQNPYYTVTYSYYPNGKVFQITDSERAVTHYYNVDGQDSLFIRPKVGFGGVQGMWWGDKIFSFEYKNKLLVKKTETNTNTTATYPVNVEKWEYDSIGVFLSYSVETYDNVTSTLIGKSKISYEYESNLLKFETNQHWDNVNNNWIQGLRFEYLYLDNDSKPDVKQFYQFINNQYVKINAKNEYFYTDTSFTEVFRQNANYFDRSVTTIKNSKQQEILVESIEYCPNLAIYKPGTRKVTNYLPNGAIDKILEYETVNECIVKDTVFKELRKIIYGYKQEINSVEDKSDLMFDFRAYPNPATQIIQISDSKLNIHSINVFDAKGIIIQSQEVNSDQFTLERKGTPAGLYYLQVQTEKGTFTKPIIWQD